MTAVLFLCAIQVVEASHLHTTGDLSAECILSSAATDAAVSTTSSNDIFSAPSVQPTVPRLLSSPARTVLLPLSRGPPSHAWNWFL